MFYWVDDILEKKKQMYIYSDVLNRIVVYFEIVDYFKFCEKKLYELFFNELDEVNIEYRKY